MVSWKDSIPPWDERGQHKSGEDFSNDLPLCKDDDWPVSGYEYIRPDPSLIGFENNWEPEAGW